jgi:hypothetical protein
MKDGKNDIIVSSNNQNYNSDDYSRPDRGSEMKILSNR